MPIEHAWLAGGIAATVLGVAIAASNFRREYAFMAGVALVLIGLATLGGRSLSKRLNREPRSAEDAYEVGYQMGYDKGWMDGRRAGRPTVVSLRDVERGERIS